MWRPNHGLSLTVWLAKMAHNGNHTLKANILKRVTVKFVRVLARDVKSSIKQGSTIGQQFK